MVISCVVFSMFRRANKFSQSLQVFRCLLGHVVVPSLRFLLYKMLPLLIFCWVSGHRGNSSAQLVIIKNRHYKNLIYFFYLFIKSKLVEDPDVVLEAIDHAGTRNPHLHKFYFRLQALIPRYSRLDAY